MEGQREFDIEKEACTSLSEGVHVQRKALSRHGLAQSPAESNLYT